MHAWGGSHTTGLFFPEMSMLLLWIVVIAGIIFIVMHLRGNAKTVSVRHEESTAEGILKEMFARGEIEKEEFEEKFQILRTRK